MKQTLKLVSEVGELSDAIIKKMNQKLLMPLEIFK